MASDPVPAVVLAAGFSRRLGRPKALVEVNGRPLVAWVVDRLFTAGCLPVVVVNADIEPQVRSMVPHASIVVNQDPDAGRTGSLQVGLSFMRERLGYEPERLVMAPVDRPCWSVDILATLLTRRGNVAPMHDDRRGHPVVLDAGGIAAVLAANANDPLREVVSFTGVPVAGPWIHMNIDTEDDVERLASEGAHLEACFSQGEGI